MVSSVEQEISELIKQHFLVNNHSSQDHSTNEAVKLKFGGDGTSVSRLSNFTSFSLSIITSRSDQNSYHHRILAVCKGDDSYETMKRDFEPLFSEINRLVENPVITVETEAGPTRVKLHWYLGSDMKMLLNLLGLKAASAKQSCIWCLVKADERHTIPPSKSHFYSSKMARTMSSLIEKSKKRHLIKV